MGTISKSLSLMNFFSETSPEIGLMDFKKLTGQDKATLHRHLTELTENGFLEQNADNRKYRLGAAILRLAAVRESTFPARKIVSQHVTSLSEAIGELVHASLISGNSLSPLCFSDGGVGGTRVYFSEADILPFHATASGIAALAFGPPSLMELMQKSDLERFTEDTIIDFTTLERLVSDTQLYGFAMSDQSFEPEVSSVAVPFFERKSHAYGTMAIAVPSSRMSRIDKSELTAILFETAKKITKDLGGELPSHLHQAWKKAA